ncbi:SSI family serine proteinase inhibitor [Streptomyces sp. NPDC006514]|uniref:SSI family serine proteinase inhibitor n=1 Tax=Streptomyces sp. NPDC006514 TaxID=3154308 RepID=UPI00339EB9A8
MRHRLAAVSAATLLCLAGTAGLAEASPASLHGPSAMVLTVMQGDDAATGTVLRAVVLSCGYTAEGTHPAPRAACDALNATEGELDRLLAAPDPGRACSRRQDPVTITADGVWGGGRVEWKHTFRNACVMSATLNGNALYAF